MTTCRHCGRDIARSLIAGIETWGHVTNPGPNHHYAAPTSRSSAITLAVIAAFLFVMAPVLARGPWVAR